MTPDLFPIPAGSNDRPETSQGARHSPPLPRAMPDRKLPESAPHPTPDPTAPAGNAEADAPLPENDMDAIRAELAKREREADEARFWEMYK